MNTITHILCVFNSELVLDNYIQIPFSLSLIMARSLDKPTEKITMKGIIMYIATFYIDI